MEPKCEIFGKTMESGVTLIRQNPPGEKAIWRCRAHTDEKLDDPTEELTRILEEGDEQSG